ncbi:chondroitin proteoglycan-2-like [Zerene cesonia]|uniref:chondroitin proteoglycan-2-like n=1 Tax=Zerene cesonia TaxID=33412 RepID=UPI0018E591D0|nr:chondroitin proteoglycan-2-like [Zerene cesonia]
MFYQCFHGDLVEHKCAHDLYFSVEKQQCDYQYNVDCSDRHIPEPEDGDTGSNCDPSEAPKICERDHSDGVLIAHEKCNAYYKCENGKPLTVYCPSNQLYNQYTEQCDWAEKVSCGNRQVPDKESDTNCNCKPGEAPSICAKEGSDGVLIAHKNGGNDNGGNDNNDNGSCNCNPSEAPSICQRIGSEGVLIAHEICNQFYTCDHGVPVTQICPESLLYNPHKEYCDWPHNVKCGDRVIPH